MRKKMLAGVVGSVVLVSLSSQGQKLLFNGDFEASGFSKPPFFRFVNNGDSSTIRGWTIMNDGIGEPPYLANSGDTNYLPIVHHGEYGLDLNQGSGAKTTFSMVSGVIYRLSFWMSAQPSPTNLVVSPLEVQIAGITTNFSSTNLDWVHETMEFTATNTNPAAVLQFFNPSPAGDYKAYSIDEVSVVQPGTFSDGVVANGAFVSKFNLITPGPTLVFLRSTNLADWEPFQTNTVNGLDVAVTNTLVPNQSVGFVRAVTP